jgi:hypothetical protein
MAKQKRVTIGQDDLNELWAISHLLCGILDPNAPESDFPKGRIPTAYDKALKIHGILDKRLAKIKTREEHAEDNLRDPCWTIKNLKFSRPE